MPVSPLVRGRSNLAWHGSSLLAVRLGSELSLYHPLGLTIQPAIMGVFCVDPAAFAPVSLWSISSGAICSRVSLSLNPPSFPRLLLRSSFALSGGSPRFLFSSPQNLLP
ncbi:hypothetical protein ACMYSQ_004745 [Aspergillus niger]